MGNDCALCGARSLDALVCAACEARLPAVGASCRRCAVPLASGGICGACHGAPPAFDDAFAVFEYRFPVDRFVHRFKFASDFALGRWMAQRLATRARLCARPDVIVAAPLTPLRLRERGFNQALELARVVAAEIDVALSPVALVKVRETTPQRALGRRSRRRNLRAAFACRAALGGKHVALVDDVITTGATAHALARVLKLAGARRVSLWAVARTP